MNKNIITTILISLSLALPGCSFNKKSTMERLKNKTDTVDSMILPKIKVSSKLNAKNPEIIDKDKLQQIHPQREIKKI